MSIGPLAWDGRLVSDCWQGARNWFQETISSVRRSVENAQHCSLSLNKNHPRVGDSLRASVSEPSNSLEELEPWRRNPEWEDDAPVIEVSVPDGSLCQLNSTFKVGLPPSAVFDILSDPGNKRVFKNIKEVTSRKVLEDYGHRQIVEVDQAAIWRFLWLSGTLSVCVLVDQDRQAYSLRYNLAREGFMKKFEGSWLIQPLYVDLVDDTGATGRVASLVHLQQVVQPAMLPPPPFAGYIRGITRRTTEALLEDLQKEGRRLREGRPVQIEDLDIRDLSLSPREKTTSSFLRRHGKSHLNGGGSDKKHKRRRRRLA